MVKYKLYFAILKNRPREVAQKATSDTANISSDEMFGLAFHRRAKLPLQEQALKRQKHDQHRYEDQNRVS